MLTPLAFCLSPPQPYIDALFDCWNLAHQTTEYYRHGEVDSCLTPYERAKTCFAVKVAKPAEAHALATALLKEEKEARERPLTHRPTVGTVWRLRKDPRADWPYEQQQQQQQEESTANKAAE